MKEIDIKDNVFRDSEILVGIANGHVSCSSWNKIYRAEVFNNVRFPIDMKFAEDAMCLINIAHGRHCLAISSCGTYLYRQRGGSAMHTPSARTALMEAQMNSYLLKNLVELNDVAECVKVKQFIKALKRYMGARVWCAKNDNNSIDADLTNVFNSLKCYAPAVKSIFKNGLSAKLRLWVAAIKIFGLKNISEWYIWLWLNKER